MRQPMPNMPAQGNQNRLNHSCDIFVDQSDSRRTIAIPWAESSLSSSVVTEVDSDEEWHSVEVELWECITERTTRKEVALPYAK